MVVVSVGICTAPVREFSAQLSGFYHVMGGSLIVGVLEFGLIS